MACRFTSLAFAIAAAADHDCIMVAIRRAEPGIGANERFSVQNRAADQTVRAARQVMSAQERLIAFLLPIAAFFLSWWQAVLLPGMNIALADILLLICALAMLTSRGLNSAMFGRMSAAWIAGITLLLAGMLIGSLAHGDFTRWPVVGGQYAFAFLLVPMMLANCPRWLLERSAIAYVLGVAASQAIGITMISLLSRATISQYLNKYVVTGNGRLGAMTGEPNSNGAVCTFALIFLLHAFMLGKIRGIFAAILALFIIAGLVASASFTGIVAATLATALVLGFSRLRTALAIALPVALIIGVYVSSGGPVPRIFEERVGEALISGDPTKAGTFVGRAVLIRESWQMADQNLVIGLGSDGYRQRSAYGMPVHQLYLLVLNEGGVMSFLGLSIMFIAMLTQAALITTRNRLDGICCVATFAVFFMYTMSLPHMFGRMWNGPPLLFFALANAGLVAAARRSSAATHAALRAGMASR